MDDGEDDDVVAGPDLVEDAVGVGGDLADVVVAEFGDDAAEPGQPGEYAGLLDDDLRDLLGVVRRVAGDGVVDGFEIGSGIPLLHERVGWRWKGSYDDLPSFKRSASRRQCCSPSDSLWRSRSLREWRNLR